LVTGFLAPAFANAQAYSLNWFKIAGGGNTSTNGQFSLSGTIGQHDAGGPMTGGNYSVTGGFWALSAVQTPGAPSLRIFLSTTNTAIVAWPAPSTGWSLQSATNLVSPNWVGAVGTVILTGGENQLLVSPPTGNRFYRLSHP
jgi:hypothetical protein